ncbi:hypothetical protein AVEN_235057-1 [Araneus ventricosus]|uniref:Uncharacterized protein n=1 Tax=Araneus ventricosus TaxID=182803 RepID=A0A4Y2F211_ARAVE|nr:hypothetical protein AVEN_235057-1 [Araneus ventricosus]
MSASLKRNKSGEEVRCEASRRYIPNPLMQKDDRRDYANVRRPLLHLQRRMVRFFGFEEQRLPRDGRSVKCTCGWSVTKLFLNCFR